MEKGKMKDGSPHQKGILNIQKCSDKTGPSLSLYIVLEYWFLSPTFVLGSFMLQGNEEWKDYCPWSRDDLDTWQYMRLQLLLFSQNKSVNPHRHVLSSSVCPCWRMRYTKWTWTSTAPFMLSDDATQRGDLREQKWQQQRCYLFLSYPSFPLK